MLVLNLFFAILLWKSTLLCVFRIGSLFLPQQGKAGTDIRYRYAFLLRVFESE